MSYLVLARKWRPQRFTELVGQGHVARSLSYALESNRVGHAFLFSGSRGVGKTTLGRLLAKGLNCEGGITADPCGECSSCRAIEEGRFIDLIEVDAASRTRVDDTRALLENVQYLPTMGRYKVYLVDEVHMLSGHSFNALLKTLEEPPDHVKFVLATTDPAKIPVTVLSRCLRFDLRQLSSEQISERLCAIAGTEGLTAEPEALQLLARAADGSLRDGLSLLDQAINFGNGQVTVELVREMLGTVNHDRVLALLEAVASRDGQAALERVDEMSASGLDRDSALAELLGFLHRVAVIQMVPERGIQDPGLIAEERARLEALANSTTPEDIQLFYQIGLEAHRHLEAAPEPWIGLEMAVIRMVAFEPFSDTGPSGCADLDEESPSAAKERDLGPYSAQTKTASQSDPLGEGGKGEAPQIQGGAAKVGGSRDVPGDQAYGKEISTQRAAPEWEATLGRLDIAPAWRSLLEYSVAREFSPNCVRLAVPKEHQVGAESARFRSALEEALKALFGTQPRLEIEALKAHYGEEGPAAARDRQRQEAQSAAEGALAQDPKVRALQERFGARLESVQPDIGDGDSAPSNSGGVS